MNASEAAVLLARISASDNREVSESAARAWADSLPDVALRDALDYLPEFYRNATRDTKNWIYPGDVLNGVIELHRARRSKIAQAARQAVLDAAEDEYEAGPLALKAMREAVVKYNAEHQVPNEKPKALNVMDALSRRPAS
jgi:hypothetical protein